VFCSQIECTTTTKETILHDNNNKDYLKIVGDNLGTSNENQKIDEEGTNERIQHILKIYANGDL